MRKILSDNNSYEASVIVDGNGHVLGTLTAPIIVEATSSIPKYDEAIFTNNVSGSPTSIVYKLAGATVLTITNTYDASNFLTHSVRS